MRMGRVLRPACLALALTLAACAAKPVPLPPAPAPQTRVTPEPARREFALEGAVMQGGVVLGTAPETTLSLDLDGAEIPVTADGRFLIGLDRDAKEKVRLTARLRDGSSVVEEINVAPRAWRIEHVNVPLRPPLPSEAFRRIRADELAQIEAARQVRTGSQGWRQRFIWPYLGRISGLFGAQRVYRGEPGSYHSGVDVAGPTGAIIRAPADGVVILATERPFSLEGNLLMIDHGMGLSSAFLHLSRIDVKPGEIVRQGQAIAAIGATGRATGPHMHWGLKWNQSRLDPLLLAGPMPE